MPPDRVDGRPRVPRWLTIVGVGGLLVAHAALTYRQFPASAVADQGLPVKGDVARYLASAEGAYRVGGGGLDPWAMAGYPVGTWNSIGKKGYELLGHLLPGVPVGLQFYILLVGSALLLPVTYVAVSYYLARRIPLVVAAGVGFALWHLDSQVAYFWHFGNVLYPGTCALLPCLLASSWRVCTGRSPLRAAVMLGGLAAWVFYAHTAGTVVWVAPVAVLALWQSVARRTLAPFLWLAAAALVASALILPWAVDLFLTRDAVVLQPQQWFQAGPKHLLSDVFSDRGYQRPFDRNLVLHIAVVAGVGGSMVGWNTGHRQLAFLGIVGIWCLIVVYTFSYFPVLRSVQPYRFLVPAVLCLGVPAARGLWEGWRAFQAAALPAKRVMIAGLLAFGSAFTAYFVDLTQSPLPCGLSRDERALLDAIRNTPSLGRVLCQSETVGCLIPLWCEKPVLGGLNDQAFLKHRFAGMNEAGELFGRPPAAWDVTMLRTYFDAYAVELAVFTRVEWQALADTHPELFEPLHRVSGAALYRVRANRSGYVWEGRATVAIGPDRIRVTDASGWIVIKLHYSAALKLPDGVIAEPVPVLDDPVPFLGLQVSDTVSAFEIPCR